MKPQIKISEQVCKVYANNIKEKKWQEFFAHIVTVDDFKFNFICFRKGAWQVVINVSENTSGCHVINLDVDLMDFLRSDTREKTIALFENKAEILVEYIEKFGKEKLKARIAEKKTEAFSICGPMPKIKEEAQ